MKNNFLKYFKTVCRIVVCGMFLQAAVLNTAIADDDVTNKTSETAQQKLNVKGNVTDEQGTPLPGVTVIVKGTTNGTVTNIDGNYSITGVQNNATLIFSFVGMKTEEIPVAGQTTINASLTAEAIGLEEVVAIGYGTVKKSDLTGSVSSVSAEEIASKGTTSVMGAIQGSTPGVNISSTSSRPGSSFNIQIRGQNSLDEGNPLYVVDGIVTGDIEFLNPSDIEKIDILKDASSTAIYGSRGSNGVVIIQTKNAGNSTPGKLKVSYDGYYGIKDMVRLPDFMDGRQYVKYRALAYVEFNPTTGKWSNSDTGRVIMSNTDGVSGAPVVANRLYNEDYTDWFGLVTRTGSQQNHSINISGATKKMTYNVGLGYQKEKGNLEKEGLDRYNLKVSVEHTPSKFFKVGATANLSQTIAEHGSGNVYKTLYKMAPFFVAYHPDGSIVAQPGANPAIQSDRGFTGTINPLAYLNAETNESRRHDFLATAYMQISPINGLNLKTTISPRFYRKRAGYYSEIIEDTYFGTTPQPDRIGSSSNTEVFDYTWDNMINYKKKIGDAHTISATGVFSIYSSRTESLKVQAYDLPYGSKWYNLYSGTVDLSNCSSGYKEVSLVSYLARVNYDYKGKYLFTGSLRYDGSSKLADKWAAFPSFAVAWRASEEPFMQADWLSNLKLRFSYGKSGNNNISPYTTMIGPDTDNTIYYDFDGSVSSGFAPGSPVNQNLTWEKTRELNLGIDFGFLNQRISGSVDLYDKLSDGLLMSRKLPIESGVSSMTDNIGSVNNRGIEITLNTVNINTKNFKWTTTFTFSHNKNKIKELYGTKDDDISNEWFIGEPVNVIYDYKYLGVWTQADYDEGKTVYDNYTAYPGEAHIADINNDGSLDENDKTILGQKDPKWIGSMTSNIQYKNWDFGFNIFTKQGMMVYDQFTSNYVNYGGRSTVKINYDYYVPAGIPVPDWDNFVLDDNGYATDISFKTTTEEHVGKYPIYYNRGSGAGGGFYKNLAYYRKTSFVKVKNITLGYTFNKNLTRKYNIERLRLYANIINPFVFTDYVGYDPEYATTKITSGNGPSTVTYQFGVNVQF